MISQNHPQFFTATILEWKALLANDDYKRIITDSLSYLVEKQRIKVFGFVVMPNHLHIIWKIQPPYTKTQIQLSFLKYTAQQIKFDLKANHPELLNLFKVNAKDREYQFWERNALSVDLFSESVFLQKLNYIHHNPVQEKWGLAELPEDYYWSSAGFYEHGIDRFGFLTHFKL